MLVHALEGKAMSQPARISPFEAIRHEDDQGEFWSAREFATVLGYVQWRNFVEVIEKAKSSCENSGQIVSHHFAGFSKMIDLPKRIILRDQIAQANGQLAETLTDIGVVEQQDFAAFHNHGWQGLYTITVRQLASHWS